MEEPNWINEPFVLAIHERQLAEHGGLDGVRDRGMLQSALAKPRNLLAYGGEEVDLPALAASYAYGIARNHPFLDGNKRSAAVVCEAFLELNGLRLTAANDQMYPQFLALAEGQLTEEALSAWLRECVVPLPDA